MFAGLLAGVKDVVASSRVTETNNLAAANEKEIAVEFLRNVVTALRGLGVQLPYAEVAGGSASVASSASSSAEHSAASVATEPVDLAVSGIEQRVSKLGKDLEEARKGDAVTNFESFKGSCTRLMLFTQKCAALEKEITSLSNSTRLASARREVRGKVGDAKDCLGKTVNSFIERLRTSRNPSFEDMKALRLLIETMQPVLEDSIGGSKAINKIALDQLYKLLRTVVFFFTTNTIGKAPGRIPRPLATFILKSPSSAAVVNVAGLRFSPNIGGNKPTPTSRPC